MPESDARSVGTVLIWGHSLHRAAVLTVTEGHEIESKAELCKYAKSNFAFDLVTRRHLSH